MAKRSLPVPRTSTILVTGASSGIGKATASLLADAGHHVYAAARNQTALDRLAESHHLTPLSLDITDSQSITSARDRIHAETAGHGPDVLINAAGIAILGPVEAVPDPLLRRQFDTNIFGSMAVMRAFLPAMRARRSGRVVNISSALGRFTLPGTGVYAATKYALEAISDALRVELTPFGIEVVVVEPGIVDTPLYQRAEYTAAAYLDDLLPYATLFPHGVAFPDKLARTAVTADQVAKTVAVAATARHPNNRYIPGIRNRLNIGLLTAMPSRATDRIKTWLMGLDTAV
jgi:NAD(P)-dependent dehydrogenase (short-subunit alcohol dehydrogenase family)